MKECGVVVRYVEQGRFGFVWPQGGGCDLFFHENWIGRGLPVRIGADVEFTRVRGQKGWEARKAALTKPSQGTTLAELREQVALGLRPRDAAVARGLLAGSGRDEIDAAIDAGRRLFELRRCLLWYGDEHDDAREARVACHVDPSLSDEEIDRHASEALEGRVALAAFKSSPEARGGGKEKLAAAGEHLRREQPYLERQIEKEMDFILSSRRRQDEMAKIRKHGGPLSRVKPGRHSHRIGDLAPCASWVLVIDETGSRFSAEKSEGREGRFVGLLVPMGMKFTGKGHAAEQGSQRALDSVVQEVLDSDVGIFGLTIRGLPPTRGDRWMQGCAQVIHWILRLLPMDGATRVTIRIEQHAEFTRSASVQALADEILRGLTETNPTRYGALRLRAQLVSKVDEPLLTQVDALAHMWGSKARESRDRVRRSGLLGTCLDPGDGARLMTAWDLLSRGSSLPPELWQTLVHGEEVPGAETIGDRLLEDVGCACREDPALWRSYLDRSTAHLESKGVRVGALGRELQWLERWRPSGEGLAPKARFVWIVAQVEHQNHLGRVDAALLEELRVLGDRLLDEAPLLVCQGDLDLAVRATNRFQFDAATEQLARWDGIDPRIPGLQHWGRVRSSLGQHAAFRGELVAADVLFAEAIEAFRRLSDPEVAAGEIRQTAHYRAIAAMERSDCEDESLRRLLGDAGVVLFDESITALAISDVPEDKYRHHLLVRSLVERGSDAGIRAYLATRDEWAFPEDQGHPWELVAAYRGLLLEGAGLREQALLELERGAALALGEEQGATLWLIGAVLATLHASLSGGEMPEREFLDALTPKLPGARDRINRLIEATAGDDEQDPGALLAAVLPFNFR